MINGIIDTHVHVWDLEKAAYPWLRNDESILNQTWSIDQVATERKEAGISAGVLVQAGGNLEDTALMLDVADKTDWIKGVVGWLPLMDVKATQDLLANRFLKEKYYKGVRHQIHDEQDPTWLLQPGVMESLEIVATANLPFDIVAVLPAHIETALKIANKIPGLRMVFDHLSQPPVAAKEKFGKWGELMEMAAQHTNFYAKISGLGTASGHFTNRKADDIKPYIEFAINHFGAERCFCGGDWPVSLLAHPYKDTWELYKNILRDLLLPEEQEQVFYSNANKFYNLDTANNI